jgi:hypothetical protein
MPKGTINVGGREANELRYKCVFSIPEGARGLHGPLNAPRRVELVERATKLILEAEGAEDTFANRFRVWCFIHEVPDGTWGGVGTIFRMVDIAAFVRDEAASTDAGNLARESMSQRTDGAS